MFVFPPCDSGVSSSVVTREGEGRTQGDPWYRPSEQMVRETRVVRRFFVSVVSPSWCDVVRRFVCRVMMRRSHMRRARR